MNDADTVYPYSYRYDAAVKTLLWKSSEIDNGDHFILKLKKTSI